MKKFSKTMLAHINVANKEHTAVEENSIKLNKNEFDELTKFGVELL